MVDIKKTMDAFNAHGFKTSYFETKQQATDYLCSVIKNTSVAFGGSVTLEQMGLYEKLSKENEVTSHWVMHSPDVYKIAQEAKIYISSVNAASQTGQIINIDGNGNRVASTIFGHEKVYFVVGINKLAPDLESAMYRARNVAAPLNAKRLNKKTPCAAKGDKCYDCDSEDRICRVITIMERKTRSNDAEIIFINEDLGF